MIRCQYGKSDSILFSSAWVLCWPNQILPLCTEGKMLSDLHSPVTVMVKWTSSRTFFSIRKHCPSVSRPEVFQVSVSIRRLLNDINLHMHVEKWDCSPPHEPGALNLPWWDDLSAASSSLSQILLLLYVTVCKWNLWIDFNVTNNPALVSPITLIFRTYCWLLRVVSWSAIQVINQLTWEPLGEEFYLYLRHGRKREERIHS